MREASGQEELASLADKDLDNYKEVTVTTKDGGVYILNREGISFPWSPDRPDINVKLEVCQTNRKLSFWLLSERGKLGFFVSQKKVLSIEAEKK